jgi:hypothetical protein
MVPPKDDWENENSPGTADRRGVRDEWPARESPVTEEPEPAPIAVSPEPVEAPEEEDPIIPWLEPPVLPVSPERPAPPSRQAKAEEGPIIVPRDYDENAARQRRGRKKATGRPKSPLVSLAHIGRSIKPTWILAIAGVILLTLIVFAMFPPGGDSSNDRVNKFTGMPIHTISTPVRPTGDAGAVNATTGATKTATTIRTTTSTTTKRAPPTFGAAPTGTAGTVVPVATGTSAEATATIGATPGIRVVISSPGSWSGTIGQQGDTYTETPVAGKGTQIRPITGPAQMVTANIMKTDSSTDLLEVRVERDGVVLKSASTTDPSGIVALSVAV